MNPTMRRRPNNDHVAGGVRDWVTEPTPSRVEPHSRIIDLLVDLAARAVDATQTCRYVPVAQQLLAELSLQADREIHHRIVARSGRDRSG